MPLLVSLLLLWGLALQGRTPPSQSSGVAYALFCWLRIVISGAVLQWLLLPPIQQPAYLKGFLRATGLGGAIGLLIVASITFLPEVRRRIARIVDARHAQGHSTRGLEGLRDLPHLLMPLVSSLLDAALHRADFWTHRGVLARHDQRLSTPEPSVGLSVVTGLVALSTTVLAVCI